MVLENTDSNAIKSNPQGMEAPYGDWQIVEDDLVDYADKDARGLTFVFSVARNMDSENRAMQKYVSVYQKPTDDNTGAFVVVSMAVDNPNDLRVYEISNTAYGNEPEDPQVFLRKVIEMADTTGMRRDISEYGDFGMIETAEDFKGTPVMDGKGGSSGTAKATYKPKENNQTPPTAKGSPVAGQQNKSASGKLKTYGSKLAVPGKINNQQALNEHMANAGFKTQAASGLFGKFKTATAELPGGHLTDIQSPKSASILNNYANGENIGDKQKKGLVGVMSNIKETFFKRHQSTAEQLKNKTEGTLGGSIKDLASGKTGATEPKEQITKGNKLQKPSDIKEQPFDVKDIASKGDASKDTMEEVKPTEKDGKKYPNKTKNYLGSLAAGSLRGATNTLLQTTQGQQTGVNSMVAGVRAGSKSGQKSNQQNVKNYNKAKEKTGVKSKEERETTAEELSADAKSKSSKPAGEEVKAKAKPDKKSDTFYKKDEGTRKNGKPKATMGELEKTVNDTNKESDARDATETTGKKDAKKKNTKKPRVKKTNEDVSEKMQTQAKETTIKKSKEPVESEMDKQLRESADWLKNINK